jgi:CDP-diacylglycerol--serine O-phosphatidyltransferase
MAIYLSFQSDLILASVFILCGLFFDFFDGMIARLLKVSGDLGKQLDSLADLITFGVAPSIIVFQLIFFNETGTYLMQVDSLNFFKNSVPFISFMIPIFSALRLAKFNIDINQSSNFVGIPTPANALFFISFPLIIKYHDNSFFADLLDQTIFLVCTTVVMSLFMVSKINLFSFKLKSLNWKKNIQQYTFILISIILLLSLGFVAVPIIILLYPVISLLKKQNEIQS